MIFPRAFPPILILAACIAFALAGFELHAADHSRRPNIVLILCDDLGYGDVRCMNPQGKIATPEMDRIAADGMIFTDAHTPSSVCTPTRYGLLTGRYAWRSRLQRGVLGGLSPRLIEPGRMTIASFLKERGYATACVGKWHLGLDWSRLPGKEVTALGIESPAQVRNVDYSQAIANGPNSTGFDDYFGISASLDMVPYAFIENDRLTEQPDGDTSYPQMHGREGNRTRLGPVAPGFSGYEVLPALTRKAADFIAQRAADAKADKPFFLYVPLAAPHTPILPSAEWQGKSGLNPYADFVMQVDWSIGRIAAELEKHGLAADTLLIVTSDNGCSPQAKFDELRASGHEPSHVFRGHKADIFEGGHRVPFIVRWPAKVKAGATSAQTICLTDCFATFAQIFGAKLPDTAAEDSVSFLPALLGTATAPLREAIVHHSINGSFAIRQGPWKLALTPGSGGWSDPRPGTPAAMKLPPVQLYDLASDIGEQRNVAAENPDVVNRLTQLLEKYVADGRSTPGAAQPNAVPINLRKERAAE